MRFLIALLSLLAATAAPAAAPRAGEVALTFDDLPIYGHFRPIGEAKALTTQLLAGLTRHHLPAIGFVNEIQLVGADPAARAALLNQWLDAGMDLGNHSYSHKSLTNTPVEAYIADVARGEAETSKLLAARGRKEMWYRYPYLETGTTLAIRHRFEGWLAEHGYRVAPVTMENSDWEFADVYDDAERRGDAAEASRVRQAYLAYTAAIVPWYRQASMALFGRDIRYVFLLHASRLNADSIDQIADILDRERLRAVPLARAVADPAYRTADDYAGPDGDEWLTRWSGTLHRDLPYATLPRVPADIEAAEARISAQPAPAPSSPPAPAAPAHP